MRGSLFIALNKTASSGLFSSDSFFHKEEEIIITMSKPGHRALSLPTVVVKHEEGVHNEGSAPAFMCDFNKGDTSAG